MLGTLQRIAFTKWTRTLGFFEFNPSNGYMEMRCLPPNTLVLTNSKALYSVIQPENPEKRFNRHTFQLPSEESFKFFSNDDKNLFSSYYQTAKHLFEEEPFFGFYPPKSKTLTTPIKCKSDVKELETLLRDISAIEPIIILLVNTQSDEPVEQQFLFMPNTNAHFNYLDVEDKANDLFLKLFNNNLQFFIKNSTLLNAYFGELDLKDVDTIQNSNLLVTSFNIGLRTLDETPLANVDVFIRAPKETAFQMYLAPDIQKIPDSPWISSSFLKSLYPEQKLPIGMTQVLPNIRPFPKFIPRFNQPFVLATKNFGTLNYLDLHSQRTSYIGDVQGGQCVAALLNYTAQKGENIIIFKNNQILVQVSIYNANKLLRIYSWVVTKDRNGEILKVFVSRFKILTEKLSPSMKGVT